MNALTRDLVKLVEDGRGIVSVQMLHGHIFIYDSLSNYDMTPPSTSKYQPTFYIMVDAMQISAVMVGTVPLSLFRTLIF